MKAAPRELIPFESKNALKIFQSDTLAKILDAITTQARAEIPDITTASGRKFIISQAAAISTTKIKLDELGKQLVFQWKQSSKAVDRERKIARDTLDALRAEIRQPVTDWENEEKDRINTINARIGFFEEKGKTIDNLTDCPLSSSELQAAIAVIEGLSVDNSYEEFERVAHQTKATALLHLTTALVSTLESEKAQEEKVKLENQKLLDAQVKHDEEIARRAAEQAREDERSKIKAELLASDLRRRNADREEAQALEKQKLEEEKNRYDAELKCAKISYLSEFAWETIKELMNLGLERYTAILVVQAIIAKKIPYLTLCTPINN